MEWTQIFLGFAFCRYLKQLNGGNKVNIVHAKCSIVAVLRLRFTSRAPFSLQTLIDGSLKCSWLLWVQSGQSLTALWCAWGFRDWERPWQCPERAFSHLQGSAWQEQLKVSFTMPCPPFGLEIPYFLLGWTGQECMKHPLPGGSLKTAAGSKPSQLQVYSSKD